MCKRISDIVRTLRTKRDMSLNEIRLTLAIEDPVAKERREYLELTVRLTPLPRPAVTCTDGHDACIAGWHRCIQGRDRSSSVHSVGRQGAKRPDSPQGALHAGWVHPCDGRHATLNYACVQALHEEMLNWPFLNDEETLEKGQTSSYASITNTGEEPGIALMSCHLLDCSCSL